jgi:hypothetical protein
MILNTFGIILLLIGCFSIFFGIKIKNSRPSSSGPTIFAGSVTPEIRALYSNDHTTSNTGNVPIIYGILIIIIGIILLMV